MLQNAIANVECLVAWIVVPFAWLLVVSCLDVFGRIPIRRKRIVGGLALREERTESSRLFVHLVAGSWLDLAGWGRGRRFTLVCYDTFDLGSLLRMCARVCVRMCVVCVGVWVCGVLKSALTRCRCGSCCGPHATSDGTSVATRAVGWIVGCVGECSEEQGLKRTLVVGRWDVGTLAILW
jgi:hypothetical protein